MKSKLRIALFLAAILAAPVARASLTSSEQAQLRQLVTTAQLTDAARARAYVARTDLSFEESTRALEDAFVATPFEDRHVPFARELLFGAASSASRPMLSIALTRALIARADAVLSKHATDLDTTPRAIEELVRIYRFLDAELAKAPRPKAGIPTVSYEACTKTLAEHIERNARWLKGDATIGQPAVRVRAQMQLALVDMMNDSDTLSPMKRVDAANRLALMDARKRFFVDLGALVLDTGKADDARIEKMRALAERLRAVTAGISAIAFGDEASGLSARRPILTVKTSLDGSAAAASPFTDEVEPSSADPTMLDMTRDFALLAARRALDAHAPLRAVADKDVRAAARQPFGKPDGASTEAGLAAALQLVLSDAPRAMDLAFARFVAGDATSAAVLSDALGVLADNGSTVSLAKAKPDGSTETMALNNVRVAPSGAVIGFETANHAWTFARDTGPVTEIRRDGERLALTMLTTARVPAEDAASWVVPGLVLAKMHGNPRAGLAQGPKLRLVGTGEIGYDAVATLAPGPDVVVETDLAVDNEPGGFAVRAIATKDGFRGAAVMLTPGAHPRIALVLREDDGFESYLAAPADVPRLEPQHVRLAVKGTKVEAKIGDLVMKGTIPASFAKGDIAFFARKGAIVEAKRFRMTKR